MFLFSYEWCELFNAQWEWDSMPVALMAKFKAVLLVPYNTVVRLVRQIQFWQHCSVSWRTVVCLVDWWLGDGSGMIGGLNLNTFNSRIHESPSVWQGIKECVLMIMFQVVEAGRLDLINAGGLAGEFRSCGGLGTERGYWMYCGVKCYWTCGELKIQGSNATRAIT